MQTKTTGDWVQLLREANVPCGPVNDIADVFRDPQVQFREMATDLDHPGAGIVTTVANPLRFSELCTDEAAAPPLLGHHTDEILHEVLGIKTGHLKKLRSNGDIA